MKPSFQSNALRVATVLLAAVTLSSVAQAQTLLVQLQSTNYNATTGVWTDSSGNGNNATATGTKPTLATGVSPNSSPAVVFSGSNPMGLASSIPVGSYTVLSYVKPATGAGPYALLGGASGSFEYRIYNSKQDNLRQQQADLGSESTAMSTSAFNVIGTILTSTGISFRLNGSADGTNAASSALTQPISAIGARASGGGENFSGSICEIDIYSGVLTPAQITAVEASFTNQYITIPPTGPVLVSDTTASPTTATVGGNDTLTAAFTGAAPISYQWLVSPNSNGSGASSLTGQTNTTLVLTNLQLSDSGKYYSLRATNTVAPYSTNSSWLQLNVVALTPFVQLIATNYDGSSVWTDSSGNGNNATYSGGTAPTLVSFVTPNGGSAVNIPTGGGRFTLGSSLAASTSTGIGYTVFAYFQPTATNSSSRFGLTGGSTGTLEYNYYQGHQNYLREFVGGGGAGTAFIPTNNFVLSDVAVDANAGTFRLNGAADGVVAGSTFTRPITRIGNNQGTGDGFIGNIAEIDIYSGALTLAQITNIEAQLTAKYVSANSIVIGPTTLSPTNNTFAGNPITLGASVIGGTGTTTYQWQTDNASGGTSYSNIGGATTTNYVLNTTGLNGTYQYHLIGTPFGGTPVTNTFVSLTVNPASAPVVVVNTTINPNPATVGGNASLSAVFVGNLPISYQWQVSANASGIPATSIAGATNATYTLGNLQLSDSGKYYSLRASNSIAPNVVNSSWVQLTVQPLAAMVQLIGTNYDPNVGVWTDSSGNGNNATYSGATTPTLTSLATPNGTPAVNVTSGSGSFLLASSLDPSIGYTVFAYVKPAVVTNGTSRYALTGGSAAAGNAALEYNFYQGHQNYLQEFVGGGGAGTATIPTNSFSLIDLAVDSSAGSFRLNGASDGIVAGSTFLNPITRIFNNQGTGDGFIGNIAEIDIYSGALTLIQITNIEAQLTAKYVAVSGIVIGAATVSPTNNTYAGNPITLSVTVIGGTGTTTYQWQTDNASGGTSFSNIGGATTTNYVLNTTGLNGTYLYQLVGTPFGGSSVTSAPVSLTVNSASAPIVVEDTTATPNPATDGGNATLNASFVGNLPIGYQWQVSANANGIPASSIAGATNTTLVLTNLHLIDSGKYYSLRASNSISPNVVNSFWLQLNVQPLAAAVQLVATNYDPVSGVWTNSADINNNATYSGGTTPSLDSVVTPNGSSAVNVVSGGGSFAIASPLDPSSGYTVFAYVKPTTVTGGGRYAIVGGAATGALEYNFYQGHQNYLIEWTGGGGAGTATIPTTGFSLIDLAVSSVGGAFRLNGAFDGSVAGATFSQPIALIGNNHGGGDGYVGEIAEVDIYTGVLSPGQISSIEAQLVAKYGVVGVATNPTNITSSVSGNVLTLSWPADHIGWRLQTQTNSLSTGLGSGWTDVSGSTSVNSVSVTINPANGTVFYRMVYP